MQSRARCPRDRRLPRADGRRSHRVGRRRLGLAGDCKNSPVPPEVGPGWQLARQPTQIDQTKHLYMLIITTPIKAPFPYFGGKSAVSRAVWQRFGQPDTYIEPFAGSLAVLLGRPFYSGREIANDIDGFITNFWRACQADPESVSHHADWPINEAD